MDKTIDDFKKLLFEERNAKIEKWQTDVLKSERYSLGIRYLNDITQDFIFTLHSVAVYATRAQSIYCDFLTIQAIDDILQSSIAIQSLVSNGIHNTVKRELRYLLEMMTKYVVVDWDLMTKKCKLEDKVKYLATLPNSSISVIEKVTPPLPTQVVKEFQDEVTDFFYKACAFVHPSKEQLEQQLTAYGRGNTIGFESTEMLDKINKQIFRAYDFLLVLLFHGFGKQMSGDLFEQLFSANPKWKFHKGKYTKQLGKIVYPQYGDQ